MGIKIMDPSIIVLRKFGNPDEIQPLSVATGSAAGGGAPGGPSGGPGGPSAGGPSGPPGGGRRGGPMGGPAQASAGFIIDSGFSMGSELNRQQMGSPDGGGPLGASRPGGGQGGPPSAPGGPGPGGFGGPGNPGAGGGVAERVNFTRWVYNRSNCKYGFIIDKFGRVVQIEAIGLVNAGVKTRKGIGFGSTFADIQKAYSVPDAYEINGDSVVMRYLSRSKVAFRLNRIAAKKNHQVTAIVVAAGKN